MNSYIFLHRLRPLISNSVRSLKFSTKPQHSASISSSPSIWRSQLCSVGQIQPFRYDVSVRQYASQGPDIPEFKKHNHSTLWLMERAVSIASLAAVSGMFIDPCELSECLASLIVSLHLHWGLEATLTDYLRPAVVGNLIPTFVDVLAASVSMFVLVLLLWCAIYGNGIVKSLLQFWYLDLSINPYEQVD